MPIRGDFEFFSTAMKTAVALAVLQREDRWLLQLRDDIDTIVYPGHWGLCGGHLEAGETPAEAVMRELKEEISWTPQRPPQLWFSHNNGTRMVHVFRDTLDVSVDALQLLEGQDLKLTSLEEMESGQVWSERKQEERPVAPGLGIVIQRLLEERLMDDDGDGDGDDG